VTDVARPKRITGRTFLESLIEAGIIRRDDFVRRVVVDASVDNSLIVYVERYGDDRLLKVATTLDGVEVTGVPA
jgi:hypothetical protein